MLEPEIESLASAEPLESRPATHAEERNWWFAIMLVLAVTLFAVWALGQLV
jgi:hypothetical protein